MPKRDATGRDRLTSLRICCCVQGESVALDEVDAEFDEGCSSLLGDGQSAVVLALREPSLVEERGRQRGSERTGQVGAPFAPVKTGERKRAPTAAGKSDVDAKPFQSLLAGSSQRIALTAHDEQPLPHERFRQSDTEPTGEMVVACASLAHGLRAVGGAQRPDPPGRRDASKRLESLGDGRGREAIAALPPRDRTGDETTREETRKVTACRTRRHTSAVRELPGRMHVAVHEHVEHRRPGGVGEQSGDRGNIDIAHSSEYGESTLRLRPKRCADRIGADGGMEDTR